MSKIMSNVLECGTKNKKSCNEILNVNIEGNNSACDKVNVTEFKAEVSNDESKSSTEPDGKNNENCNIKRRNVSSSSATSSSTSSSSSSNSSDSESDSSAETTNAKAKNVIIDRKKNRSKASDTSNTSSNSSDSDSESRSTSSKENKRPLNKLDKGRKKSNSPKRIRTKTHEEHRSSHSDSQKRTTSENNEDNHNRKKYKSSRDSDDEKKSDYKVTERCHSNYDTFKGISSFIKIRIAGLNRFTSKSHIIDIFRNYGRIIYVDHPKSLDWNGRRCAYIVFSRARSAHKAMARENSKKIDGCRIVITPVCYKGMFYEEAYRKGKLKYY